MRTPSRQVRRLLVSWGRSAKYGPMQNQHPGGLVEEDILSYHETDTDRFTIDPYFDDLNKVPEQEPGIAANKSESPKPETP